jgi:hypothetical protein
MLKNTTFLSPPRRTISIVLLFRNGVKAKKSRLGCHLRRLKLCHVEGRAPPIRNTKSLGLPVLKFRRFGCEQNKDLFAA